jgi:hypothetical protein
MHNILVMLITVDNYLPHQSASQRSQKQIYFSSCALCNHHETHSKCINNKQSELNNKLTPQVWQQYKINYSSNVILRPEKKAKKSCHTFLERELFHKFNITILN